MQDDIVKRLNLPWPDDATVEEVTLPAWALELMGQGAREITALRAEVKAAEKEIDNISENYDALRAEVKALEAERDRLREAARVVFNEAAILSQAIAHEDDIYDCDDLCAALEQLRPLLTTKGEADER